MELMDEQEMIRKAYFDATQASGLPPQWIYEFALNLLAAHNAGTQEPVAYLHEMHMEGDQMYERLTFDITNAFGEPGRDYSESYEVTCTPLYDHPQPITDAARDVAINELRNIVRAKRFDRKIFECDGEFADWAQNRARYALSEIERLDRAKGE